MLYHPLVKKRLPDHEFVKRCDETSVLSKLLGQSTPRLKKAPHSEEFLLDLHDGFDGFGGFSSSEALSYQLFDPKTVVHYYCVYICRFRHIFGTNAGYHRRYTMLFQSSAHRKARLSIEISRKILSDRLLYVKSKGRGHFEAIFGTLKNKKNFLASTNSFFVPWIRFRLRTELMSLLDLKARILRNKNLERKNLRWSFISVFQRHSWMVKSWTLLGSGSEIWQRNMHNYRVSINFDLGTWF